jgi:acyl-CoA synthetase (AMP-forming)/AMP-acid ligase II
VSYNLSVLFEQVADAVGERTAVIVGTRRELTYAQLDERANRLAHYLAGASVGAGDHVGLLLMNGTEYLEGMLAAFKLRAVPVNVNYRYVARELEHLFTDADLLALVAHRRFGPPVAEVAPRVASLRCLITVDDDSGAAIPEGSADYEEALRESSPVRDFEGRTSDDLYIAYTGGTTGMPKGVLWRHEDIFFGSMGGGDPTRTQGAIATPEQLVERILPVASVQLVTAPLMHVSGHWGAFGTLYSGGTVVLADPGPFDPAAVLDLAARVGAHVITLVGDATVRPVAELLRDHPGRWDLSSLFVLASGGALLSSTTKDLVHRVLPNVILLDGYGATETGIAASEVRLPGSDAAHGARFTVDEHTAVLDDNLQPVGPGSGIVGHLARRGHLPIGYHKDPEKTAATFVEVNGVRWALPGDHATVEADGTIVLHGRASLTINTGGEKVFPEEVEEVLLAHPAIQDAVVVGVPDERWGQRVVAVVEPCSGASLTLEDAQEHCRRALAGYKVPRDLVVVDRVQRAPNGKADYAWTRARVEAARSLRPPLRL